MPGRTFLLSIWDGPHIASARPRRPPCSPIPAKCWKAPPPRRREPLPAGSPASPKTRSITSRREQGRSVDARSEPTAAAPQVPRQGRTRHRAVPSPRTGEVTMATTRRGRGLAWISTIPHFLYFTALRENQPVWYQVVVWSSGLVCALAVLGLVLGIVQSWRKNTSGRCGGTTSPVWSSACSLRPGPSAGCSRWSHSSGPTPSRSSTPRCVHRRTHRARSVRRVAPGRVGSHRQWTRHQGDRVRAYPRRPLLRRSPRARSRGDKRPERLHQPYYITGRAEADRLLVRADTLQVRRETFSAESLVARLRAAAPDVPIVEQQMLTEYDWYDYSRQQPDAAAGAAGQVRGSRRDMVLHRSVEQHDAVAGDAPEPRRALAVQRLHSFDSGLLRHAPVVGHRDDPAAAWRPRQQLDRTRAWILTRRACPGGSYRRAARPRHRPHHFKRGMPECESVR